MCVISFMCMGMGSERVERVSVQGWSILWVVQFNCSILYMPKRQDGVQISSTLMCSFAEGCRERVMANDCLWCLVLRNSTRASIDGEQH